MKGGVKVARGAAAGAAWPLLVLLLVSASVHADAVAAPARRLLLVGADGATVQPLAEAPPPPPQVSVSKAAGLSCGTYSPQISCPPSPQAP
jgi:hypothetical protein|uniref:Uncharacterized protein n=1 Tax=Saccharum hybrid cultivar SP80-3280 TaxID=193079 RepID=A0A2R4QN94_9POAL|nr:hypothetical protein Shy3280Sca007_089 [Saccharum hybrid cultivar SP80-3280]